jgi:indolepyruvate ferredoxin oxidoreductase, beta subunit
VLNVILAGVGGQGIVSVAYVLAGAALSEGFQFKQSEVHGMSQRGGAVSSHLRIAREPIWSDLVADGTADLVLAVEPLEALRYVHSLRPGGAVVASTTPYVNIPDYPDVEIVLDRVCALPTHVLVDGEGLAALAGGRKAENMVLLGAAAWLYPFSAESCRDLIRRRFAGKSEKIVRSNLDAFAFGEVMSAFWRAGTAAGIAPRALRRLVGALDPRDTDPSSAPLWKEALDAHPGLAFPDVRVPGTAAVARRVLAEGRIA